MKESPRRYTNPFLSDEENDKLNLWDQELEHSNTEHDKLINTFGQLEFHEKESGLYTDKNVMECELPELLICYKEGAFHVKDICVDEGVPHGERFLFDDNNNGTLDPQLLSFSTMEDYYMESNLPVLEPSNDHMNIGDDCDEVTESNDHTNIKEEVSDSVDPNELKEISKDGSNDGNGISKSAPDGFMFTSEAVTISKATDNDDPDISMQPGEERISSSDSLLDTVSTERAVSSSGPSLEQDRLLPSLQSLLESIDQQPCQSPVEEISKGPDESGSTVEGNNTLNDNDNNTKPATSSEDVHNLENLEHVDEISTEPYGAPKLQDMGSDNAATLYQIHRGDGESSFSVAGQHITYSGPIAFSGSTSLRSESSTTSTRSFAFPILQNEWNSSPVRMAKADRRRLQKHRGWRHGLLCCRF